MNNMNAVAMRRVLQPRVALFMAMLLLCGSAVAQVPIDPPTPKPAPKPKPEPAQTNYLTVNDQTSISARANSNGSTFTYTVRTNAKTWECYSDDAWITPKRDGNSVKVVVGKNPLPYERKGVVHIKANPNLSATITIHQDAKKEFEVNGNTTDFGFECKDPKGCKADYITVNSSDSWNIVSSPNWMSITDVTTNGFYMKFTENKNDARQGVVSVKSGNRTINIKVSQSGAEKTEAPKNVQLTVNGSNKDEVTLYCSSASGCEKYVSVSSSTGQYDIKYLNLMRWVSVKNRTSTGFTLVISENKTTDVKKDWFKIEAGNKSVRVYVEQVAGKGTTTTESTTTTSTKTTTSSTRNSTWRSTHDDFCIGFTAGYTNYHLNNRIEHWDGEEVWGYSGAHIDGLQFGILLQGLLNSGRFGIGLQSGLYLDWYTSAQELQYSNRNHMDYYFDRYNEYALLVPAHLYFRYPLSVRELTLTAHTGFDFGYYFGATYHDTRGRYDDYSPDYGDDYSRNHLNVGYSLGFGVQYSMMHLDFMWTWGLTNHDLSGYFDYGYTQMNQFTLRLTFLFD